MIMMCVWFGLSKKKIESLNWKTFTVKHTSLHRELSMWFSNTCQTLQNTKPNSHAMKQIRPSFSLPKEKVNSSSKTENIYNTHQHSNSSSTNVHPHFAYSLQSHSKHRYSRHRQKCTTCMRIPIQMKLNCMHSSSKLLAPHIQINNTTIVRHHYSRNDAVAAPMHHGQQYKNA